MFNLGRGIFITAGEPDPCYDALKKAADSRVFDKCKVSIFPQDGYYSVYITDFNLSDNSPSWVNNQVIPNLQSVAKTFGLIEVVFNPAVYNPNSSRRGSALIVFKRVYEGKIWEKLGCLDSLAKDLDLKDDDQLELKHCVQAFLSAKRINL